jgi:hypothetical protein
MVLIYRTILPRKSLCLERAFSKTSVVALSFFVREFVKYEKGKRKREKNLRKRTNRGLDSIVKSEKGKNYFWRVILASQ